MTLSRSRNSSVNYNQNWSIPGFDQHSVRDGRDLIAGQSVVAQTEKGKFSRVDNTALQAYAYQNDDFMSNESYERMMRAINSQQKNKDIIAKASQNNVVEANSSSKAITAAKESATKPSDNYVAYAGNLLSTATRVTIKEDTGHTSKDLEHKLEQELAQNHVHGSVINPEIVAKQESSQDVEIEDQASRDHIRIVRSTPTFIPTMRVKRSGNSEQEHVALVAAGLPYGLSAKQVANIVAIAKSNPEEQASSSESVDNTLLLKSSSTRIVSNSSKAIESFVASQDDVVESVVSEKPSEDKDSPTTVITQYTGGFVSSKGNAVDSVVSDKADKAVKSELVEEASETKSAAVDVQEAEDKALVSEQESAHTEESVDDSVSSEDSVNTESSVNAENSVETESTVSEQEIVEDTQQESSANLDNKEETASEDNQNTPKGEFEDVSLSDGATIVTLAKGQSLETKVETSDVSTVIVRINGNNVVEENTKDKDVSALGSFTTEDVADSDNQAELNPLAGVSADTELVDNSDEVLEPVSDVGSSKEQETVVSAVLAEALGAGVSDEANLDESDDKPSRRRGRRRKTR